MPPLVDGAASPRAAAGHHRQASAAAAGGIVYKTLRRKLVVVGDGAIGKTSLLTSYKAGGAFTEEYVPTVFENSLASVRIEDKVVELSLWDTAGQEDYDRLRPLTYPDTHVVLVCFAIDKPDSLVSVHQKWAHELDQHCPGVPRILVACKGDLRAAGAPVTSDEVGARLSSSCLPPPPPATRAGRR